MPKKKVEPGLIDYWDRLTSIDILLIHTCVERSLNRNQPGALPFLPVKTAVVCIDQYLLNIPSTGKRGPFYRLLHKLESWKHERPKSIKVEHSYMAMLDEQTLNRVVPVTKRQKISHNKWRARLPFVKGEEGWFTLQRAAGNAYYIDVADKYYAALRAWLTGITLLRAYPAKKRRQRRR